MGLIVNVNYVMGMEKKKKIISLILVNMLRYQIFQMN